MTTETKPATDEEIEALRKRLGIPGMKRGIEISVWDARRILAAYDTERARADKAEEEAETIGMLSRIARETSAARLTAARQHIAALREAREKAEDRAEELEREARKVAAEFEGDATKTLGNLAAEFDETFHEWSEREDGWTVDNAAQAIYDGRADLVIRNDALAAQLAEARQQVAALREALNEAHPYVEMAEFLGSRAFSYSGGYAEPSPAEWGITVGYVQTAEQMPYEQFADEVDAYHQRNREEDDGSGEFLTLANKIAALAQTEEAEG